MHANVGFVNGILGEVAARSMIDGRLRYEFEGKHSDDI